MPKSIVAVILSVTLLGVIFPASFAQNTKPIFEIITIEPGNRFVIKLESNRTTGFQWQIAEPLDKSKLQLIRTEYIAANKNIIGGGGKEVWFFKALSPGRAVIIFKYVRPWEKEGKEVKTKSFIILIREEELLGDDQWGAQTYE